MSFLEGFIDCHTHLADSMFDHDIDMVIENARKSGVVAALVCTITPRDFSLVLRLCEQYSDILVPCLGIHPVQRDCNGEQRCVTQEDLDEVVAEIEKNADKICAIGEVGLDFQPRITPETSHKDTQKSVLKAQVDFANKFNLPLNVHSRSAGKPTIAALKEFGARRVLLHAFDGRPSTAMEGVAEGYFFSIPPSIVRNEQMKLVKQLPIENMVLETDCPGLGPVKGERNEPSNIQISCDYIAKIKGMTPQEVKRITSQNAVNLFPKLKMILK
ncbi:putative deoxyribonuclease TATDN3 [Saccostrea echinata]|uniref:putative deoxyribonuclease TATDN3 n=1 Tax=Saccostrea echinata TaxID=191078 RepID=UPI002A83230D|nr:putative deoxyribonuclease TATDN3 [Saccostrea echinata]